MSYCPGGLNIHGCPAHSESIPEQTECICSAGFWSEDGDHLKCTPCPEGAFCPGENTKEDCPADSTSPVGSKEVGECLCLPAFYEEVPREDPTAAPACVTCPAGAYCPGGADKTPCPSDTFSPVGAGQMAQCLCNAGLFGTAGQCVTCSVNSYCLGGFEPTACPDNTESVAGVEAVDGCTCVAGFFGTTACDVCPAGEKCTGGDAKGMCPALTDSDPGASVCTCVAGYYGPETECEECHSGQYCIGNGIEQACPDDTLAGLLG
ncbi:hypothetical protein T484DRAFT_1841190 [Baffinella frigidus]|nr:hypothetical protein T484DRAFT_1841190 [Cryptophyta sp. CCMP2293]